MSKLLTLKEISAELGVPESSVRKYREIFGQFIPSVGSGRSRRYRSDAVAIFHDIRYLREENHIPWDAIAEQLAEKYPIDATPGPRLTPSSVGPQSSIPRATIHEEPTAQGAPDPHGWQEQASEAQPPKAVAVKQHSGDNGSAAFLKRAEALGEKQMMMVNAMAIEMLRSMESVRVDSRKQSERIGGNFQKIIIAMLRTIEDVSHDEKALLRGINAKLDDIRKRLDSPEKPPQPKVDETAGRLAALDEEFRALQKKLEQRDKLVLEYKQAYDNVKKENADLKVYKQRAQALAAQQKEIKQKPEIKEADVFEPRKHKKSGKSSFVKKIFGSK